MISTATNTQFFNTDTWERAQITWPITYLPSNSRYAPPDTHILCFHQIELLRDHILHSPTQFLLRSSLPRDHSSFIFPCPKSTSSNQSPIWSLIREDKWTHAWMLFYSDPLQRCSVLFYDIYLCTSHHAPEFKLLKDKTCTLLTCVFPVTST